MADFSAFVDSLQGRLQALGDASVVHVTVGNDSCDLDSIASALAYAHFLAQQVGEDGVSLPLLQCQRAEFAHRREAVWVVEKLKIDPMKLVFADDLPPDRLSSLRHLSLTLVDHHLPCPAFQGLSATVTEAIDHHQRTDAEITWKTTIEPVGSCSTLVAERLLAADKYKMDGSVATLLLAAILLDTGNLAGEGRVTDKDREVEGKLSALSSVPQDELYQSVFKARFDTSSLTSAQLLQRDFKLVTVGHYRIGFTTITALLTDFLQRAGIADDLAAFFSAHSLHALVILGITASPDGQKRRQVAVYQPPSTDPPSHHDLADSLASVLEVAEELRCERVAGLQVAWPLLEQHSTGKSRKDIIPLLTEFLDHMEKEGSGAHKPSEAAVLGVSSEHPVPQEAVVSIATPSRGGAESTPAVPLIPEYTVEEETRESRTYRLVQVGGEEVTVNLSLIEPYKKIVQHAGYSGEQRCAVVVISACYLPSHHLPNYSIIIEHLFYYVLSVLDHLVVDDYVIVYLNSGAPRHSRPSIKLLHKFYKMVDRRLRKQLMDLYIVHPSFWVKTLMRLGRPLISGKFYRKVHFVRTLRDLSTHVTLDDDLIPAPVVRVDSALSPPELRYKAQEDEASQQPPVDQ